MCFSSQRLVGRKESPCELEVEVRTMIGTEIIDRYRRGTWKNRETIGNFIPAKSAGMKKSAFVGVCRVNGVNGRLNPAPLRRKIRYKFVALV